MKKAFSAAWRHTVPIFAGYIFLGITFGFLVKSLGYPAWLPIAMSIIIYSGALEFAAVPLLGVPFDPVGSFIMALMLSARHLFYGIPMLKKYENSGPLKYPLIALLTDETFSVCSSLDAPRGVEKKYFNTIISVLNYFYWVGGTTLGVLIGQFIRFDTTGIDFSLTALFLVLFLEQLKTREGKFSGTIGLVASAAVLLLFGSKSFVVISMVVILAALLSGRRVIVREQ